MALAKRMRIQWWQATLMAALIALLGLFYSGLGRNTSFIPSPLIGRAAPSFTLPNLNGGDDVSLAQYRGEPVIVNFWASWCIACRQEHEFLVELGKRFAGSEKVHLVGIDYKDSKRGALRFLESQGKFPYPSAVDKDGRVGLDYGVYGLPETFFLDAAGTVVAKHIGPLNAQAIATNLALLGLTQ